MKITVFDLGKESKNEALVQATVRHFKEANPEAEVITYQSADTKIKDCIGCFNCWWKSPGECALKDAAKLNEAYINSDEVVLLFNTENGFIDGKGKTFLDRIIPLYLPYTRIRNGECGHLKRYDRYPVMNFYFDKNGLGDEEVKVIRSYLARTAYHFYSPCKELLYKNETVQTAALEYVKPIDEVLAQHVTQRKPHGKWVIYNGSPRGNQSNSKLIIEQMMAGMKAQGAETIEVRNLINTKEHKGWAETFSEAENNLFVFPLYIHAMPGSVMKFFGQLQPVNNPEVHMAFFVQSGFPETGQSYYLRPYLELLTQRLGVAFDGTIVRGGMEGTHVHSEEQNEKTFEQMRQIGKTYAEKGIMDQTMKKEYEKMARLPKVAQIIYSVLASLGLADGYWHSALKKNGTYEKRFAKPYRR